MSKYNMDGISDAYFVSDKQYKDYTKYANSRKEEKPPKQTAVNETDNRASKATSSHSHHNHNSDRSKGQYEKILGISDPAFSGGDEFAAYAEYLKRIAKENEPPADDQSAVEIAVRTKTTNNSSHKTTASEWFNSVRLPIQTTPYAKQANTSPYSVGIMPTNQDTPQQLLAQRNNQQLIANSMGAFRLAAQQADEKSANNARIKAAMEAGRKAAQEHGLDSGSMPLSQYGSRTKSTPYSTGILPANQDTPQQILTQRAKKEQIANSMGAFRLAAQQADKKSAFNGSMPETKTLNDLGAAFDYLKTYGEVMGGTKGETIAIAAEILSSNIKGMKIGSAIAQETTDKNNEIELSTIATAAGVAGDIIGSAVGSFVAGPVGAFAGGYLGDQLFTELAIAIYNSQPVSWEEALERTSRLTSPFMPQNAQSPQELLNERQTRIQDTTGRGDFRTLEQQDEARYEQLANAQSMMDDLSQYARDNRISSIMP